MAPTIEEMEKNLDRLYWTDTNEYLKRLEVIKGLGYKVLRNSKGIHKIQMDMSSTFGGIFAGIFNNHV